ncbi:MAG TPA: DUF1731 domain-containing protein [Verrucomicrobiae bacterium]
MKIILAGGSGQVGQILQRAFAPNHELIIPSRQSNQTTNTTTPSNIRSLQWDGATLGPWTSELNHADALINLAGRSVNCRYGKNNRREIIDSRVNSTRVLGEAISQLPNPPRLWLQSSTATIYAHVPPGEPAHDENGTLGGHEPGAPDTWRFSIQVATAWEKAFDELHLPQTRKVKLRSAMIMSPDPAGVFDTLLTLVKRRLGGRAGNGRQYVSWIHEHDFIRALEWIIAREDFTGHVNLCSPNPLPNSDYMRHLRQAAGINLGLPAANWMLEIGALFLRTETELILKSRRVIPARLLKSGFQFQFPDWAQASSELCARSKKRHNSAQPFLL